MLKMGGLYGLGGQGGFQELANSLILGYNV